MLEGRRGGRALGGFLARRREVTVQFVDADTFKGTKIDRGEGGTFEVMQQGCPIASLLILQGASRFLVATASREFFQGNLAVVVADFTAGRTVKVEPVCGLRDCKQI